MAEAKVALILAVSKNGVIGEQNAMPWKLPTDLKRFKKITTGHPIVMGRRTYESIGGPLPNRENIVLSKAGVIDNPAVQTAGSLEEACSLAKRFAANRKVDEIMIIGGGDVFEQVRGKADKVYLTTVDLEVEGDTVFRPLNAKNWKQISTEDVVAGPNDSANMTFSVHERKSN